MNGSIFSMTRYMIGVGFRNLGHKPVPQLPLSYPPPRVFRWSSSYGILEILPSFSLPSAFFFYIYLLVCSILHDSFKYNNKMFKVPTVGHFHNKRRKKKNECILSCPLSTKDSQTGPIPQTGSITQNRPT